MLKEIRIIQANVQKSIAAQDTLLRIAESEKADFVLVQEPYIRETEEGVPLSRSHPAYSCFLPTNYSEGLRPGVATYALKDLLVYQTTIDDCPNLIWIRTPFNLHIGNFYKSYTESIRDLRALGVSLPTHEGKPLPAKNVMIGGDFNLHHWLWEPSYQARPNGASAAATALADWITDNDLSIPFTDVPAHDRGHMIDLSLSTVAASAEMSKDCGSDHRTILTRIRPSEKPPRRQCGISLPPEETERFVDRVKYFQRRDTIRGLA